MRAHSSAVFRHVFASHYRQVTGQSGLEWEHLKTKIQRYVNYKS